MPNPNSLKQQLLKQLDALRIEIENLADDAELGRRARALFSDGASNGYRSRAARRVTKRVTGTKKNGVRNGASKQSDLSKKILELVQAKKTGIGTNDIALVLKAKPHAVSYQIDKLRAAKLLRSQGKTRRTLYFPAPAQA